MVYPTTTPQTPQLSEFFSFQYASEAFNRKPASNEDTEAIVFDTDHLIEAFQENDAWIQKHLHPVAAPADHGILSE